MRLTSRLTQMPRSHCRSLRRFHRHFPTDGLRTRGFVRCACSAGPYTTDLTEFRGRSPNGVWSLYIYDDTDFNFGRLSAGWSLELSTVTGTADLQVTEVTATPNPVSLGGTTTFTAVITNAGPDLATSIIVNAVPTAFQLQSVSHRERVLEYSETRSASRQPA